MYELVVFDVDGVLTDSRQPLADSRGRLLQELTLSYHIGLITGGTWKTIDKNVLRHIPMVCHNRILVGTQSGAIIHRFHENKEKFLESDWLPSHVSKSFSKQDADEVEWAMENTARYAGIPENTQIDGPWVENRGWQITFSALGQAASLARKREYDPDGSKRQRMIWWLSLLLPKDKYEIVRGGLTSVDVTYRGINKAYGVRQMFWQVIMETGGTLNFSKVLFIGDHLEPGGNDASVQMVGCTVQRGDLSTIDLLLAELARESW